MVNKKQPLKFSVAEDEVKVFDGRRYVSIKNTKDFDKFQSLIKKHIQEPEPDKKDRNLNQEDFAKENPNRELAAMGTVKEKATMVGDLKMIYEQAFLNHLNLKDQFEYIHRGLFGCNSDIKPVHIDESEVLDSIGSCLNAIRALENETIGMLSFYKERFDNLH